jgi:hypothetical protein
MKKEANRNMIPVPINKCIEVIINNKGREKKILESKPPTRCKKRIITCDYEKELISRNEDTRDRPERKQK